MFPTPFHLSHQFRRSLTRATPARKHLPPIKGGEHRQNAGSTRGPAAVVLAQLLGAIAAGLRGTEESTTNAGFF